MMIRYALFLVLLIAPKPALAIADGVLCTRDEPCNARGIFTKASAGPSKSDSIRVNPAAVPVEKVTGIESIYYKNSFSLGLVKGLGRVGAAISPSNSEETFFGAPAPETDEDYEARMTEKDKFASSKYTAAVAFNIFKHKGRGLLRLNADLGIMARYFTDNSHVTPGAGLQLSSGPLLFGASLYGDENPEPNYLGPERTYVSSNVATWNVGLSLESFLIDYSVIETAGMMDAQATVATITGFIGKRAILTAARREVISDKPAYDFKSKTLISQTKKVEYFAGAQYRVAPFLVLGVYYNYHLLREASAGVVIFF